MFTFLAPIFVQKLLTILCFVIFGMGHGYLFLRYILKNHNFTQSFALINFAGFWFGCVLIYFLTVLFPQQLVEIIYGVSGLSVLFFVIFLKEQSSAFIRHPYFAFLLVFAIFAFHLFHYFLPISDEFSQWLLGPKDLFYNRSLLVGFYPSYTPLWPLALSVFQFLITSEFSVSLCYTVAFFISLSFIFTLYDLMRVQHQSKFISILFIFVLMLISVSLYYKGFVGNILSFRHEIEKPLTMMVTLTLLMLYIGLTSNQEAKTSFYLALLFVVVGYLLKKPLIAMWPCFCVAGVMIWFQKKISLWTLFGSALVLGITFVSWKITSSTVPATWEYHLTEDRFNLHYVGHILSLFFLKFLKLKNFTGALFVVAACLLAYRFKLYRFLICLLTYVAVYLLGTLYTYMFSFSLYEASYLASFDRYFSLLSVPLMCVGSFLVFIHLPMDKVEAKLSSFIKYSTKINLFMLSCILLASTLYIREIVRPFTRGPHKYEKFVAVEKVINFIDAQKKEAMILIIDQGGRGDAAGSVPYFKSGKKTKMTVLGGESFGPNKADYWTTVVTQEEMQKKIKTADYVFILKSDPWLEEILKGTNLVRNKEHRLPMLLRQENETFKEISL